MKSKLSIKNNIASDLQSKELSDVGFWNTEKVSNFFEKNEKFDPNLEIQSLEYGKYCFIEALNYNNYEVFESFVKKGAIFDFEKHYPLCNNINADAWLRVLAEYDNPLKDIVAPIINDNYNDVEQFYSKLQNNEPLQEKYPELFSFLLNRVNPDINNNNNPLPPPPPPPFTNLNVNEKKHIDPLFSEDCIMLSNLHNLQEYNQIITYKMSNNKGIEENLKPYNFISFNKNIKDNFQDMNNLNSSEELRLFNEKYMQLVFKDYNVNTGNIIQNNQDLTKHLFNKYHFTSSAEFIDCLNVSQVKFSFRNNDFILTTQISGDESEHYSELNNKLKETSQTYIEGEQFHNTLTKNIATTDSKNKNDVIYVVDAKGTLYFSENNVHHSYFLSGKKGSSTYGYGDPVSCAGHILINNGKVTFINNETGHYHATENQLKQICQYFNKLGVLDPSLEIEIIRSNSTGTQEEILSPEGVKDFLSTPVIYDNELYPLLADYHGSTDEYTLDNL